MDLSRRTQIIATIEKGTNCNVETLSKMIAAGMNVARINFDSEKLDEHFAVMDNLREAMGLNPDK